MAILARLWGEEIPFHVIGRKYTKGTNSRHGKNPYTKTGLHSLKMYCTTLYNTDYIITGFKMTKGSRGSVIVLSYPQKVVSLVEEFTSRKAREGW